METPKHPAFSAYSLLTLLITGFLIASCSAKPDLPHWLKGKWKAEFEDYSVTETWSTKNDTMRGKTLWSGSSKVWFETLSLYRNDKQELVYTTMVDNNTTHFVCKETDEDTLVFINNANDFPKRLNYVRPKGKKLEVWIDNSPDDSNRIYFHFKKIR